MRCTRISVWFLDDAAAALRCMHVLTGDKHDNSPRYRFEEKQCKALFDAMRQTRTYAISDVSKDTRVADIMQSYLKPNHVTALLGAPFRQGVRVRGIILHEYTDGERDAFELPSLQVEPYSFSNPPARPSPTPARTPRPAAAPPPG